MRSFGPVRKSCPTADPARMAASRRHNWRPLIICRFASDGAGQIVAIVDAYDDPNAASDLAYYRSYFGLPAGKLHEI